MTQADLPLSVVVTARNDNHGGDLLRRMQIFTSGWLEQCRRWRLRSELLFVEWNPPADRPRLIDALRWPADLGPTTVRFIEVPAARHARLAHADKLPLFQMIAKNVGIRRARGQFILATNIDLLFSDELVRWLAAGRLRSGRLYRIDRHDVDRDVPLEGTLDEQLAYCRGHVLRIASRQHTKVLATGACYAATHGSRRHRILDRLMDWGLFPIRWPALLHLNACGDFTLLHRDDWHRLGGYAEWEIFSLHLDSLLCHAAHAAGIREVVLTEPLRLYHIEHGAGWTPEGEAQLMERIGKLGLPALTGAELMEKALQMRRAGKPENYNGPHWGFADEVLPETTLSPDRSTTPRRQPTLEATP